MVRVRLPFLGWHFLLWFRLLVVPFDDESFDKILTDGFGISERKGPHFNRRLDLVVANVSETIEVAIVLIHNRSELVLHNFQNNRVHGCRNIFLHIDGILDSLLYFLFDSIGITGTLHIFGFHFLNDSSFMLIDDLVKLGIKLFDFL